LPTLESLSPFRKGDELSLHDVEAIHDLCRIAQIDLEQ
jgi:hypothetical protein